MNASASSLCLMNRQEPKKEVEVEAPRLILTSSRWLVSAAKILKRLAMDVRNISPKTPAVIIEL